MESCALCCQVAPVTNMFSVSNRGTKTFECKDETKCKRVCKENADKAKTNKLTTFREKFGVNMEDLVELSPRMRDASIHYYDKVGDRIFTKCLYEDGEIQLNESPQLRRMFKL